MRCFPSLLGCGLLVVAVLTAGVALAVEPAGIVYQSEAISSPKTAWQLNKRTADRWMLWTTEQDIERKRSGRAVLASPSVAADRKSPAEGAPPLHSVVTDLKPGCYLVYVSNPGGQPLGYSLDGKTWIKHAGGELALGARNIANGRFELWVDDRYARVGSLGAKGRPGLRRARLADDRPDRLQAGPRLPQRAKAR